MKYEIGDYVRIKNIHIDDEYLSGVVDDMLEFSNKLARITDICDSSYPCYHIDLDDGKWDWDEDMFKYRLGNYEDNKIENHRFKYEIGYHRYENRLEIFEGFIENFYPNGKSAFVDENGKLLVLPYERIEFIVPKESDND